LPLRSRPPQARCTARRSARQWCSPDATDLDATDLDAAALTARSRERLGGHKYPRRIEVVPVLPISPTGKIVKRELVKDLSSGR
jgi:acyl-CoA synthetase (AMP-forming)/AMP-acid ligase II